MHRLSWFRLAVIGFVCALAVVKPLSLLADDLSPRPIKLGAIVSLTGDAALNGQNWLDGARLAIEEIQASGRQAQLVVEDDGTAPARVASSFIKLATIDKVDGIIGGTWDFLAETAYPLARQYKIPFITPTNPVEVLSPSARKNAWIFSNGMSLISERKAIDKFILSQHISSLALVFVNVPYGTLHAELVRQVAKERGVNVVLESTVTYQGFQDEIKLAALRISQRRPDMVFVVLSYAGVDLLLREFERSHTEPIVLMTHTLKEAYDFGASPKRYERAFGLFPLFESVAFAQKFFAKFKYQPYDYAAAGYDAVNFMAQLADKRVQWRIDNISLTYNGVTGRHALPTVDRGVVQGSAVILTIAHGSLVDASPLTGK
ncbi:MAG: ABC transporter substrate-binding protein [Oligoflexia bacterium]|nr:ABC transporter substrate-binding protein [Oligoflexia bacterium]